MRGAALDALGKFSMRKEELAPLMPRIVAMLADTKEGVAYHATKAIGMLFPLCEPPLLDSIAKLAGDESDRTRAAAVRAMGGAIMHSKTARPQDWAVLNKGLEDPCTRVRSAAAAAFASIAWFPGADMEAKVAPHAAKLAEFFQDADESVRQGGAKAFRNGKSFAEPHIPALSQLLRDPWSMVREAALGSLGTLGRLSLGVKDKIRASLEDTSSNCREAAQEALQGIPEDGG